MTEAVLAPRPMTAPSLITPDAPFTADGGPQTDHSGYLLLAELEALMQRPETLAFLDQFVLDGLSYWNVDAPEQKWVSPGLWRSLGFSQAAQQSVRTWLDLIFPEDRERALQTFRMHLADPSFPYDLAVRYLGGAGGTVTMRCRGLAVRDGGVAKRMLGTHTVVSQSRQPQLNSKLDDLLELADDPVIAWTSNAGIQRWSRGAHALYGFSPTEAKGAFPGDLLQPKVSGGWDSVVATVQDGKAWKGDVEWLGRDKRTIHTATTLQRIARSGSSALFLQIDRDIGEKLAAEQQQAMLVQELNHRVKNLFAVVQSLVSLSARLDDTHDGFATNLSQRIKALAQAHAVSLDHQNLHGAPYDAVIRTILSPYAPSADRLTLSGDATIAAQGSLTPLSLILNELATNALKHGAWGTASGAVAVDWRATAERCTLRWIEEFGVRPERTGPRRDGFGSKLIAMAVAQLGGTIEQSWSEHGLRAVLDFPRTDVLDPTCPARMA